MRGLVLGGGGGRGAYEVGVLKKVMRDEKRDYDFLAGVSVGALNAGYLAQAPLGQASQAFEQLEALWLGLEGDSSIFEKWKFWPASVLLKPSIYSSRPLRSVVAKNLSAEAVRKSGRVVRVGAVSWDTGEYREATEQDPDFVLRVLASAAYPVVFEHVTINEQEWGDGGIKTVTPLSSAIRAGCDEVDVIMTGNPTLSNSWATPAGKRHVLARFSRFLELIYDEIMLDDISRCHDRNELARFGRSRFREVKVRLMMPSTRMEWASSTSFDPALIRRLIDTGYKEAYAENF